MAGDGIKKIEERLNQLGVRYVKQMLLSDQMYDSGNKELGAWWREKASEANSQVETILETLRDLGMYVDVLYTDDGNYELRVFGIRE